MKKHAISVLLPVLFFFPAALNADMYYWNDAEGNLIASDQQPPAGTEYRTQKDLRTVNVMQQSVAASDSSFSNDETDDGNELPTVKWSPSSPAQSLNDNANITISAVEMAASNPSNTEITPETLQPNDEAGCQQLYGTNCDKVFNWKEHGEKYCQTFKNEKCNDSQWFEKRFKPLTLEERHKRTLRNAAKNNRQIQEVRDYLHRKYTGVCATDPDQLPKVCKNPAYDAKMLATFQKLNGRDQSEIRKLQEVLKTSKDRSVIDRTIEELISYLPWAAAANGL